MTKAVEIPVNTSADETNSDAIVVLTLNLNRDNVGALVANYLPLLEEYRLADASFEQEGGLIPISTASSPVKRLIYSPIGPINRDFDDVRRFTDAALRGVKRALKSGSKKPLIVLPTLGTNDSLKYARYDAASILGAYEAIYVPLEIREAIPTKSRKVESLGFTNFASIGDRATRTYRVVNAIESGRSVARDIGGSDPERMSAPRVAQYVTQLFQNTAIKVEVMTETAVIEKQFPCLGAVNRGSVDRHQSRVIFLSYEPPETATKTVILVGKGVTYDTGGADIKAGGIMAGMHRDKCGSAAVAGFFHTVAQLQPRKTRVLGAMAMVRNSIGPNCYVADEIITSRNGVRVRVGNTDAEGRMAMVDVLAYYKELVVRDKLVDPQLFTIATLTGHCCLAVGDNYSIIMDNGPARERGTAQSVQKAGDQIGDLFEISTIRREDYDFNKGKSEYEDILQCNNAPSSRTPRGHQLPAAFLIQVSGLDKHGIDSALPIAYSHIDIAGSSGPFPGLPTGAPIAALTTRYLINED